MKVDFRVPKVKNEKPVLNEEGQQVYEKYIYDFEQMGMDRKLMARKFFQMSSKNLSNQPKEPDHVQIIADRKMEIKAFSAILMKQMPDGSIENYDPSQTELSAHSMNYIGRSEEDWNKLMECQTDFFTKAGLQLTELMSQSNATMMQSIAIMQQIAGLAGSSADLSMEGIKDFGKMILDAAVNMNNSHTSNSEQDSMTGTIGETN